MSSCHLRALLSTVGTGAALLFIACSSETPPPVPAAPDAAADAATDAGADVNICPPRGPLTGAITWTSMYTDFFGPTGKASCAGDGACHGTLAEEGTRNAFYLCDSKDGCWKSMRSKTGVNNTDSNLVRDLDISAPKRAALLGVLRTTREDCTLAGFMPKRPPYRLTREEAARIEAWIGAGALND